MRKPSVSKWAALLLLVLPVLGAAEARVVATFYPVYVLAGIVTNGADVRLGCMAQQSAGCLHDYTLQTGDVAAVEEADVLIANGGGMEQFIPRVRAIRPDLPVIEACDGLTLLDSWEAGLKNAHVWLAPKLAAAQVENIAAGISAADPGNAPVYAANASSFGERMAALDAELSALLAPVRGSRIITFHEAFTYFAESYGLEVAGVIAHEPGEAPSAREIAETCDLVGQLGVRALFVEPQYPQNAAEIIARETGASIYTLDPFVSGDGTEEGYEQTTRQNARILLEALRK